jgi:hypothetical protein
MRDCADEDETGGEAFAPPPLPLSYCEYSLIGARHNPRNGVRLGLAAWSAPFLGLCRADLRLLHALHVVTSLRIDAQHVTRIDE